MNTRALGTIFCIFLFLTLCLGFLSAQSNSGEVHIYVFSEMGMPMKGVETELDGRMISSDESGLIQFIHPPGTHDFTLFYEGQAVTQVSIPVRQNQVTEIIVTASQQEQTADAEVETSDDIKGSEEREELDVSLPTGSLIGRITHIETGKPVPEATIIFRGVDYETVTDERGEFQTDVPEGDYSVSVIHPDFSTQTMDNLEVAVGETTEFVMELTPSAIELDTIPVFAATEVRVQGGIANLIEETKNSGVVLNLIGVQQFSRSGDSDAASALKRVTGLTVVNGRYIYVRGMGERYSSSYLNGALIPSPELDKRVVPLDLFPTSVIESMAVQKSYSPDMLGDFGGGAVRLRTMGIPEDRYKRRFRATLKASIAYDMGSTFTTRLMEEGGKLDWLGIDDGTRAMPEAIGSADKIVEEIPGVFSAYSKQEIETLGESFPNSWDPSPQFIYPDYTLSGSIRDKLEISDTSDFAYSLSLMYKNGFDSGYSTETSYGLGAGNTLTRRTDLSTQVSGRNIDIGVLADFAFRFNDTFGLEFTSLLTRITENNVETKSGYFSDESQNIIITLQEWIEQMLFSQKVSGEIDLNVLNNAGIDWQYAFSLASRYVPDRRSTRYDSETDEDFYSLSPQADGAVRAYANVLDLIHDGSFQMNIPVFFTETSADFIDFGGQVMYRTRETDSRSFQMFYDETDFTLEELAVPAEELLTPENIHPEGFRLRETTVATDNYIASQLLAGGFLSTDILLFKSLRFNPGLRFEYSSQQIDTFDLFTGEVAPSANLTTYDLLPVINFTLPFAKRMQLRFGVSKTVNRPDFRELSPQPKEQLVGEEQLIGNPVLKKADIYNADLRWETYLAEEENISIGAFFKYFRNAIELRRLAGAANPIEPANIENAYNIGGELEWQLTFRFLSDALRNSMNKREYKSFEQERRSRKFIGGLSGFLRDLHTSGNFSYIWSQVDFGTTGQGINTTAVRPLQGQSPFVLNVSLGYKNSVSWSMHHPVKLSLFASYNVFGRRISKLGTSGLPDYYEEPFHQLDVVATQRFTDIFSISIKAKNILDLPARETITVNGEKVVIDEYKKGRSFSLGVSFDF